MLLSVIAKQMREPFQRVGWTEVPPSSTAGRRMYVWGGMKMLLSLSLELSGGRREADTGFQLDDRNPRMAISCILCRVNLRAHTYGPTPTLSHPSRKKPIRDIAGFSAHLRLPLTLPLTTHC